MIGYLVQIVFFVYKVLHVTFLQFGNFSRSRPIGYGANQRDK